MTALGDALAVLSDRGLLPRLRRLEVGIGPATDGACIIELDPVTVEPSRRALRDADDEREDLMYASSGA